jgi:hypothetical protein
MAGDEPAVRAGTDQGTARNLYEWWSVLDGRGVSRDTMYVLGASLRPVGAAAGGGNLSSTLRRWARSFQRSHP